MLPSRYCAGAKPCEAARWYQVMACCRSCLTPRPSANRAPTSNSAEGSPLAAAERSEFGPIPSGGIVVGTWTGGAGGNVPGQGCRHRRCAGGLPEASPGMAAGHSRARRRRLTRQRRTPRRGGAAGVCERGVLDRHRSARRRPRGSAAPLGVGPRLVGRRARLWPCTAVALAGGAGADGARIVDFTAMKLTPTSDQADHRHRNPRQAGAGRLVRRDLPADLPEPAARGRCLGGSPASGDASAAMRAARRAAAMKSSRLSAAAHAGRSVSAAGLGRGATRAGTAARRVDSGCVAGAARRRRCWAGAGTARNRGGGACRIVCHACGS